MFTGLDARGRKPRAYPERDADVIVPPREARYTAREPSRKPVPLEDFVALRTDERVMSEAEAYEARGFQGRGTDEWSAPDPPRFTRPDATVDYLPTRHGAPTATELEVRRERGELERKRYARFIRDRDALLAEGLLPSPVTVADPAAKPRRKKLTRREKQALSPREVTPTVTAAEVETACRTERRGAERSIARMRERVARRAS